MDALTYLQNMVISYSNLKDSSIILTGIISVSILLVIELFSFVFIRISDKKWNLKQNLLKITLLQSFRIFLRFLIIYLFLMAIKSPEEADYPARLIYRGAELAILSFGIISAVLKMVRVVKKRSPDSTKDFTAGDKLKITSEKSIRIIVFLIVFSLFISQLKREFALELQTELWISLIVIINSILLMIALFFAVEKILPQIQNYMNEHFPSGLSRLFLLIIAGPLKVFIIALFLISIKPVMPEQSKLMDITSKLIEITASAAIIMVLFNFIEIFITRLSKYSELETNSLDKTLIEMIRMIIRVCFIVVFIFLSIRVITGKPLTTLLAGLGIGGLAVALAAQDTLKNFFGSIMIMIDKPFKVGERITGEGYDGTIESIGFRSTRIRTLTGNQVVIPNDKVAQSSIENIGRRQSIRRLTNITITYSTPPEKVELALSIIRGILDNHEGMPQDMPPRVFFNEFNAASLNILVLYWYSPPNYWEFMRFSEEVNLKIMKMFAAEGIEFAFPTYTTYLEQEDGKSLKLDIGDSRLSDGIKLTE
ncbi:MAG: mechanosensitive ion channel family protein [Spirochaetales bacterium]|nr:mechanosensitive ion channel family protein [Spirochaetales bacterium]